MPYDALIQLRIDAFLYFEGLNNMNFNKIII